MKKMMVILLVLVMVFVMVGSTAVANQETGPYGLGYWRQYMRHNDYTVPCPHDPEGIDQDEIYGYLTTPPRGNAETICRTHLWVAILNLMEGHFNPQTDDEIAEFFYYRDNYYLPAFATINSYMIDYVPWLGDYYVENPTRQQYLKWKDGMEEWVNK